MYDWIPLAQTVLYALVLLFGLMVAIPVGITKEHFDGECPLYANVDSSNYLKAGDVANCNYVIYMHVVLSCLLGGILSATFIFVLISEFRGNSIMIRSQFSVVLGLLLLHIMVAFLSFIAACIMTVGLKEFCDNVEKKTDSTCKGAQNVNWGNVRKNNFYDNLTMAEIAAWLNVSCWIVLMSLSSYVMIRVRNKTYPPGPKLAMTTSANPQRGVPTVSGRTSKGHFKS